MAIYNFGKVQETETEAFDSICIAYVAYVSLCSLGRPNCIGERSDMLGWSKSGCFCRNDCVKVPFASWHATGTHVSHIAGLTRFLSRMIGMQQVLGLLSQYVPMPIANRQSPANKVGLGLLGSPFSQENCETIWRSL